MKFAFVIAALFAASAIAAPCGRKHVDDVSDVTDVPQVDDTPTAPVSSDAEDERKTTVDSGNDDGDSQTAVINNNSVEKGGHGSLVNVDANNILAGGLLSNTKNVAKQSS